ncbi:phage terminase large subunit family protein [Burkholderia sp. Cy-647]|nr:phage terminase large subunit family protein [Burkholderia sp. Tr-860]NIF63570.1 phage terminase large subunit family protein [Burkholderia sp. Cy-647]NIF97639.1 phage terminase large subunit family protein [Burkholderia sp. Ax-1720]
MDALNSFLNTSQTVRQVIRRLALLLRPPERIGTTEWARKHRRMSAKATATPGRYNPSITPWVFGMHDALDDPTVQKVVCMKSAQVAWTDGVLLNYVGRRIDVDPCPMIIMFAKEKSAKKFNMEKFEPMVEVTPRLSAKLPVHAARDKNNLWDHKTYPRGFLKFITSNAPDDVKSTPAPVVAVEEPDDANANVREQGDSITLLEERNKSYSDSRRKVIFGGTPTVDGFSRIQQAYGGSDQRVYLVPCPDCGEEHELAWENVTWSDDAEVPHELDELAERAMPYAAFTVPAGGLLLTLGVDVQHDRIALVLRAWGRGEESWLVVWDEIHGNVLHQDENPLEGGVWGALTEMLMSGYRHETGGVLRIRAMSIDSSDGSTSDAVYKYVRAARRAGLNVMAIKGSTDANAEVFSVPKQSVDSTRNNSKAAKYGLRPFMVGVSKAKDLILENRFKLDGEGPGRMHWHVGVRSDYLSQVTAEVKVPGRIGSKRVWQKKAGARNEALDCEVYALHAARSVKTHLMTEAHWSVEQVRISQSSLFEAVPILEALPSALPIEEVPDPPAELVPSETAEPAPTQPVPTQPVPQQIKPAETPPPSGVSRIQGRRMGRSSYLGRR